jgi:long-chain acyl-CoA synthetase
MLVNDFLVNSAHLKPHKIALVCQGQRLTYTEIDEASIALGEALIAEGLQKQDRVVVHLDNSVESVVSIFGILHAGGIFVVIDPKVKARKLAYIMADCNAKMLISDSNHIKQISELLPELSDLKCILATDFRANAELKDFTPQVKLLDFRETTRRASSNKQEPVCIDIDLASLIYTSGSSGNPKGVMLTHRNMVSAAESIIQYLGNEPDDIIIDTLPLSFDYGLYQLLMTFKFGGTLILEKGFIFPEQIIRTIVKEKVTGWPVVPTIVAMLCRQNNLNQHDFSHLRYITSTGQVLPSRHITKLRESFPKVKIYSMYGLTECKRVAYLPPDQICKRPESVGKAMPNTEAYIVDDKGKEITEAGKPGELVVRGSNVMQGYWNLPEATAKALRPGHYPGERVLYSGDLFKKDAEGYLYFLGRKDDIIKTSGHMVSPKEVENILCEIEDVVESAVIGVEDEILGHTVKAFVHVTENSKLTDKDVITYCSKHLEDYAIPKQVVFCGPLPRTDSGKVKKLDLH